MKIFGLEIKAAGEDKKDLNSFIPPVNEDGAVEVAALGNFGSSFLDLNGKAKSESDLVTRYRQMERDPQIARAIDDIVNEAIVVSEDYKVVHIDLSDTGLSAGVKRKIDEEFKYILRLLDFSNKGYDIFNRWYVDGRLRYHIVYDEKNPKSGIQDLRYVDPRKLRKIRELKKRKHSETEVKAIMVDVVNEYYVFSEKGFGSNNKTGQGQAFNDPFTGQQIKGFRVAKDSIIDVNSGLLSEDNSMVLSYLDGAFRPLNQLKSLEDASVIYRLARAPERRVFYVDVGDLPKMKAEQYLHDMMVKHKNKLVYNADTGEIRDDRRFMTMMEDFWLPRREGGRGTEVTTLPGGANLGEMDDVKYFQGKLYEALNVPRSRLDPEAAFSLGRSGEITRDEVKFSKFIKRLRSKFSNLFDEALEKQLVMKGIMSMEEWRNIKNEIRYDFEEDNHYQELKDIEILNGRIQTLRDLQDYVGLYFSKDWVRRRVLYQSDQDIERIDKEIELERKDTPPAADGDANDDGYLDSREGGTDIINNSFDLTNQQRGGIVEYLPEQTLEESLDEYLRSKLNRE
jgi:polyhydroxyalkanoate synthesis regulator phasin